MTMTRNFLKPVMILPCGDLSFSPSSKLFVMIRCAYLIPAKVVDEHHANKDDQQAEALEGEHGHAKSAVLSGHTGGVVLAVGAALLARQAVAG